MNMTHTALMEVTIERNKGYVEVFETMNGVTRLIAGGIGPLYESFARNVETTLNRRGKVSVEGNTTYAELW